MDMLEITDDMTGSFAVRTSSGSLYRIDLDSMPRHIVRLSEDRPPTADYSDVAPSRLRKDGLEIPLIMITELTVGRPGRLWLDIRSDGISTFRETTPVVSISRLADRS